MVIHDVPQGFKAYGIGMTEAEYTKLSNAKSFEDIEEFFSKYK